MAAHSPHLHAYRKFSGCDPFALNHLWIGGRAAKSVTLSLTTGYRRRCVQVGSPTCFNKSYPRDGRVTVEPYEVRLTFNPR